MAPVWALGVLRCSPAQFCVGTGGSTAEVGPGSVGCPTKEATCSCTSAGVAPPCGVLVGQHPGVSQQRLTAPKMLLSACGCGCCQGSKVTRQEPGTEYPSSPERPFLSQHCVPAKDSLHPATGFFF